MTDTAEAVKLDPHQWNVVMSILRLDTQSEDASNHLGDVSTQAQDILQEVERQLGRDGVERH